jgi:succinate dehydrogenase/fumarate reductase flavoprotein subunit
VEVGPVVEYFEGGIAIDESFRAGVPGLYAAGECALAVFGANRVSAATTEMLVEGAIAGWAAAEYASGIAMPEHDAGQAGTLQAKALQPLQRRGGIKPAELRRRIQRLAQEKLGAVRDQKRLDGFIAFLEAVREDELENLSTVSDTRIYNKEWIEALELENIVQVLDLSARSARMRTESRGVHYRADHPHTDNGNWLQEIICKQVAGEPVLEGRSVAATILKAPEGVIPFLDMLKRMMLAHSDISGHH